MNYVITLHGEKVRDCQDNYALAKIIRKHIKGSKIMKLVPTGNLPQAAHIRKCQEYTDLRYKLYVEV